MNLVCLMLINILLDAAWHSGNYFLVEAESTSTITYKSSTNLKRNQKVEEN